MNKRNIIALFGVNLFINLFIINRLKIFFYKLLLGYDISYKASLGLFSIFIVQKLELKDGSSIGAFCLFYNCNCVKIDTNAKIYRFVHIMGARLVYVGASSLIGVKARIFARECDRLANGVINGGRFIIGSNVTITNEHIFDITGNILIKEKVVIGGRHSMFYTHGFDCFGGFSYGDIILSRNIYVGANVIFLPGIRIGSNIVIGAGTVVSKSLNSSGSYVGNPVRKVSDDPISKRKLVKKY